MAKPYRLLVIDDEQDLAAGLKYNLEFEGYIVDTAHNGLSGLNKVKNENYALILLDIMMQGQLSGFDVCKTLRNENIRTPIIFLSAKSEEIDKVLGLELGADDYITKPFSLRELSARVKAVLRRFDSDRFSADETLQIGNLSINMKNFQATTLGAPTKISTREIEIIRFLYSKKNQNVSRDEIINCLWETKSHITSRTVDNFIVKLRQKIENDSSNPKHIITIHGKGYRLCV